MKAENTPWLECEGYVLRRHFLEQAKWVGEKLVAEVHQSTSSVDPSKALDWIYHLLTAMDAKASALMRLNGVMLAAAAFLLGLSADATATGVLQISSLVRLGIVITAAASSVSILLCLLVVNVSWYFLGKVEDRAGTFDYTEEFRCLQRTAKRRQLFYRLAWWISFLAGAPFVAAFLGQLLYAVFGWGF